MGRPSSLTEKQWLELGHRLIDVDGHESVRQLAKEYGTSETSIRSRFPSQRKDMKDVATQMLNAEKSLAQLPVSSQLDAINLLNQLRAISGHLAGAATLGAATAHRLSAIAHKKVESLPDDHLDEESIEELKSVAVLTRMANDSSFIGLGLLKANKDAADEALKSESSKDMSLRVTFGR